MISYFVQIVRKYKINNVKKIFILTADANWSFLTKGTINLSPFFSDNGFVIIVMFI